MGAAVGIDLGTTNTVVGAVRDGKALTLGDGGRRLIPSIVAFHPSGKVLVGEAAKERRIIDPQNTIYSVKRLIGRTWDADEVQRAIRALPFELVEGPKQGIAVVARGETYTLPEISAFVLRRAKAIAEEAIGETVDRAVITVPANFNDLQRAATKLAGKLAGLEVLRILNEPTAAALAYGQSTGKDERIAVYDLGGGTFDITLLDLSGNVFEVLATGGDTALGGDDVDQLIADQMSQHFLKTLHVDPRVDASARATLRARAEVVKIALSTQDQTKIELNDVVRGEGGVFLPATYSMTRAELETLARPLIERTLETCRFSMETIGLKPTDIHRIILVGGSPRMPLVVRRVEEYFKRPALGRVNPDEVVALGAAIQAAALTRVAVTSISIAASGAPAHSEPPRAPEAPGVLPLVAAPAQPTAGPAASGAQAFAAPTSSGSGAPARPSAPPVPANRGGQGGARDFDAELVIPPPRAPPPLPPRKAAAMKLAPPGRLPAPGATGSPPASVPAAPERRASAAPPPGHASDRAAEAQRPAPLLIDVTPISLGVETAGGFCDFLITANTPVPCDRTRVFLTASDGQTAVVVRVAQGESKHFAENTLLGDLHLTGLAAAARGDVQVAVTFEIDVDGILNVRARDQGSGRETSARLHTVGTQTDPKEVERMIARQTRQEIA